MKERVSDGRFAPKEVTAKKAVKSGPRGRFGPGDPKPPNSGRKPGVQNKVTRQVKEWLAILVDKVPVQDAIEERIIKGDAVAFFRALDHVIGKPKETTEATVKLQIYEWGKR